MAIAELVGGDWPARLRRALLDVYGSAAAEDDDDSVRLLHDIKIIFDESGREKISSAELMERLLRGGTHVALATHDERLIKRAVEVVGEGGIARDRFEFQMLYGIRRDLQERLAGAGFTVRVYVPYGSQWYPYFMRRLAERPANVAFILRSLVREVSLPRR